MTKFEYLKLCVQNRHILETAKWYFHIIGIPLPQTQELAQMEPLTPYPQPDGMYVVMQDEASGNKVLTKLTDAQPNQPVFHIRELIDVDHTWLPTISGSFQTKLGNLLINAVALYPSVKGKIPYMNDPINSVKVIEAKVAKLLKSDDEATDSDISISEYEELFNRLWFFSEFASLFNVAATARMITAAPGTKELRQKLLEENKGKLSDPAVVANIAAQLDAHDKAYLKEDEVAQAGLSRKENTARKKLHQMYGETNDFTSKLGSDPITGSMDEGLDTDPKNLAKYINDLRYASYSRGDSTKLAGYTYKILQRSLSGLSIVDEDCGTQRGFTRLITNANLKKTFGRYVKVSPTDKQWTLIEDVQQAEKYLGKTLVFRSALYCKSEGSTRCYRCLGETFKGSAAAMTNLAASISSEFMTLFLKRMHTSGFGLTTIERKDLIT